MYKSSISLSDRQTCIRAVFHYLADKQTGGAAMDSPGAHISPHEDFRAAVRGDMHPGAYVNFCLPIRQ